MTSPRRENVKCREAQTLVSLSILNFVRMTPRRLNATERSCDWLVQEAAVSSAHCYGDVYEYVNVIGQ